MSQDRCRWAFTGVYALLGATNAAVMITEPTTWQAAFAIALLSAAMWFGLDRARRVTS